MRERRRQKIVLMVGIAGSGKSTMARSEYSGHERVSLDDLKADFDLRWDMIKEYESRGYESRGYGAGNLSNSRRAEYVLIEDALAAGRSVVVDDTNLTADIRGRHIEHARLHGAAAHAVYFNDRARAYRQNAGRSGAKRLPRRILGMQSAKLEPPTMEEGYASIRHIW